MKIKMSLLAFVLPLLSLTACGGGGSDSEDTPTDKTVSIQATPESIVMPAAGGTATITVTTTGKEWGAYSTDESWLTTSVTGSASSSGSITVTATANTKDNARSATVTIMSGTARKTVTVTQDVTLHVSKETVRATSKGGTVDITVVGSSDWTATASDAWITVEKSGQTLSITTAPNTETALRSGTVTVKTGSETVVITVEQAGVEDTTINAPEGYTLVWHDEFDTDGAPSTGSDGWYYEKGHGSGGWGNNEIQNYVDGTTHPKVCFIEDGILNIVMQKVGSEVQSIRMNTNKAWTYGWFEARLRLPSGKGTWPAFWMMPKNFTSWPGDGEIDIMEEVGYDPNRVHSTIHCTAYNGGAGTQKGGSKMVSTAQSDFHVYALEWTESYIRGLVDGQEYFRYKETGSKRTWPFDAPFYLKLNLAWGGNWGGAKGIDESCLPATYQIDYVRVFQK